MRLFETRAISWVAPILSILVIGFVFGAPGNALAATNQATGDIAGDAGDLTDSNIFTINSSVLALVKAAFLTDGTALADSTTLPRGTEVQFLIYVDNDTDLQVDDVNIQDDLGAGFTYVDDTLKIDNSLASGATVNAIYTAVAATGIINDLEELGDEAGEDTNVITAGSTAGNAQLDVPDDSVWAMLFTAEVQ